MQGQLEMLKEMGGDEGGELTQEEGEARLYEMESMLANIGAYVGDQEVRRGDRAEETEGLRSQLLSETLNPEDDEGLRGFSNPGDDAELAEKMDRLQELQGQLSAIRQMTQQARGAADEQDQQEARQGGDVAEEKSQIMEKLQRLQEMKAQLAMLGASAGETGNGASGASGASGAGDARTGYDGQQADDDSQATADVRVKLARLQQLQAQLASMKGSQGNQDGQGSPPRSPPRAGGTGGGTPGHGAEEEEAMAGRLERMKHMQSQLEMLREMVNSGAVDERGEDIMNHILSGGSMDDMVGVGIGAATEGRPQPQPQLQQPPPQQQTQQEDTPGDDSAGDNRAGMLSELRTLQHAVRIMRAKEAEHGPFTGENAERVRKLEGQLAMMESVLGQSGVLADDAAYTTNTADSPNATGGAAGGGNGGNGGNGERITIPGYGSIDVGAENTEEKIHELRGLEERLVTVCSAAHERGETMESNESFAKAVRMLQNIRQVRTQLEENARDSSGGSATGTGTGTGTVTGTEAGTEAGNGAGNDASNAQHTAAELARLGDQLSAAEEMLSAGALGGMTEEQGQALMGRVQEMRANLAHASALLGNQESNNQERPAAQQGFAPVEQSLGRLGERLASAEQQRAGSATGGAMTGAMTRDQRSVDRAEQMANMLDDRMDALRERAVMLMGQGDGEPGEGAEALGRRFRELEDIKVQIEETLEQRVAIQTVLENEASYSMAQEAAAQEAAADEGEGGDGDDGAGYAPDTRDEEDDFFDAGILEARMGEMAPEEAREVREKITQLRQMQSQLGALRGMIAGNEAEQQTMASELEAAERGDGGDEEDDPYEGPLSPPRGAGQTSSSLLSPPRPTTSRRTPHPTPEMYYDYLGSASSTDRRGAGGAGGESDDDSAAVPAPSHSAEVYSLGGGGGATAGDVSESQRSITHLRLREATSEFIGALDYVRDEMRRARNEACQR